MLFWKKHTYYAHTPIIETLYPLQCLLAQACQHLWLGAHHDVYREFTSVHHTLHPAPSPPDAGRYTVPSRFRCQSGDCGYRVRRLCTGRCLPAHLRRILLMEQQVWSVHARQAPLRPRVAVIHCATRLGFLTGHRVRPIRFLGSWRPAHTWPTPPGPASFVVLRACPHAPHGSGAGWTSSERVINGR